MGGDYEFCRGVNVDKFDGVGDGEEGWGELGGMEFYREVAIMEEREGELVD